MKDLQTRYLPVIFKQFQMSFILQQISRPFELRLDLVRDSDLEQGLLCLSLIEAQFFH